MIPAGFAPLFRLAARRDRVIVAVWAYVVAGTTIVTAVAFAHLYGDPSSRRTFGVAAGADPSIRALYGPVFSASTVGGLTAWRMVAFSSALIGLMCTMSLTRHTRAEEEAGRLELLGATVVERSSPLLAGVAFAITNVVAITMITTVGLAVAGIGFAGALAFGVAYLGIGAVFTGVGAVAAQLTESARAANGIGAGVVGLAYLVRGVGDASGSTVVSCLSPIGWAEQVQPYAANKLWLLAPLLAVGGALIGVALVLQQRRDLGRGLLAARSGPPRAARSLARPLGLVWRLQRGTLVGWLVGSLVSGLAFGAIAQGITTILDDSPQLADIVERMGGQDVLINAYLAAICEAFGMAAAIYVVIAVLRWRAEESAQRVEPVLATSVGRLSYAFSHLVVDLAGVIMVLVVAGAGLGLGHGARVHEVGIQVPRLVGACLAQLPAVLVFLGLTAAVVGLVPRYPRVAWIGPVVSLLITQLGPVLRAPGWLLRASPFAHVPDLPGGTLHWSGPLALTVVALVLVAGGTAGWKNRDIG